MRIRIVFIILPVSFNDSVIEIAAYSTLRFLHTRRLNILIVIVRSMKQNPFLTVHRSYLVVAQHRQQSEGGG
jgi:hypothetical protein